MKVKKQQIISTTLATTIKLSLFVNGVSIWPLFIKFLTPGLICELDYLLNDWLESTNHPEGYLIRGLIRELKVS